jgi:hypothetical protein
MSVSSISSSVPVQPAYPANNQLTPPVPTNDNDADDAGATQPAVQPALPPGQGTQINQLV